MNYRDRTFCDEYLRCDGGDTCGRALTPEVLAAAERWWGKPDAPISVFVGLPDCFTVKEV